MDTNQITEKLPEGFEIITPFSVPSKAPQPKVNLVDSVLGRKKKSDQLPAFEDLIKSDVWLDSTPDDRRTLYQGYKRRLEKQLSWKKKTKEERFAVTRNMERQIGMFGEFEQLPKPEIPIQPIIQKSAIPLTTKVKAPLVLAEPEKDGVYESLPEGFSIITESEKTPISRGVGREWEEEKESVWGKTKDIALGGIEAGGALAAGLLTLPIAGLAGLTGLPFGKANEWLEKTGEFSANIFQPRTEMGKEITGVVSVPFQWIHDASRFYGDIVYDKTNSPNLAAGVATTFELASYALLAKGVKGIKGKIKPSKIKALPMEDMLKALEEMKTEPAKALISEIKSNPKQWQQWRKTPEDLGVKIVKRAIPEITKKIEKLPKYPPLPIRKKLPAKGVEIEGKPIPTEERLLIKKKGPYWEEKMEEAKLRVGGKRGIKEIATDANILLGEKGAISFRKAKLTPDQIAAKERLVKDIDVFKDRATKAGKEFEQYLKDEGLPANMARAITQFGQEKGIVFPKKEEDLPKYTRSINLEKQDIPDSLKRMEEVIGRSRPKKVQIWDETGKLSEAIRSDYKKMAGVMAKAKKGKALTAAEIDAARQTNVNAMHELKKLSETLTEKEFNKTLDSYVNDIFHATSEASSEIGRALNIHKKEISLNRIAKAFSEMEKGLNERQLADFKKLNVENPIEVKRFLDNLKDPTLRDYVIEYWYNCILSGLPTHVVNVASNTAWLMYHVPHRIHTAMWDKVYSGFKGKARTRYINEVIPMLAGYKTGAKRGIVSAGKMMKVGEIAEFETKWAQEIGYKAIGAWERSPHAWMRKVAPGVSLFTRALRAMDVFANSIAYDGEINSIARRLSKQKGLKGETARKWETKFKENLPEEAHEQGMKYAKHNTFMDDPDPFTQAFLKARDVLPWGTGRFVVPFVNTIGNLFKRGLEFTPGVGILKEAASRKMGRGLGTPEIIAKQIEGSLLALYILWKCERGDIIGRGGKTKAERDALYRQGKKPWSIRFGGKLNKETGIVEGGIWIQYRRAEPWNTPIASVAIAYDEIKNAKDDATRTEIFGNIVRGLMDNLIDSSYFQGMQQIFNKYEKFKEAPFRFGASFVPASSFWRSMNRAYEKATEGKVNVREKQGWLPALAQVIPFLPRQPTQLNTWGEEKVIPGSVFQHWLPYKWSKEIDDPVEKEFERLNKAGFRIYPALPGQQITIKGEKIKLDDDIYRTYCISYGNKAKTVIGQILSKKSYQSKDDEIKIKMIDEVLTSIRMNELGKVKKMIGKKPIPLPSKKEKRPSIPLVGMGKK